MGVKRGSRNVAGNAVEARTVAEAVRQVQLKAQQTGTLAPGPDDISTVLAAQIFTNRPASNAPAVEDANTQLAARAFGPRATGSAPTVNKTLTFGTHLDSGDASYDGTADATITSDATDANTASTIVARDASGDFHAGSITLGGSLTASSGTGTFLHLASGDLTISGSGTVAATGGTGNFLHLISSDGVFASMPRVNVNPTGTSDIPVTHTVDINLNGTTYKILLST